MVAAMNRDKVQTLLDDLAAGWAARDYRRVAARFTEDVDYADPLRYRLEGRASLLAFFEDDEGRAQSVTWRDLTFDPATQRGAVEYTYQGSHRYHGVAMFALRGDLIARWREYQHVDPRGFEDFAAGRALPAGDAEVAVRALVDRETRAWDEQDAEALADLFHPDMVWPWPTHPRAHDPADWVMFLGRFDRRRWIARWRSLFDDVARLERNQREIARIVVSAEGDGALAVVDIDTLWRMKDGSADHWVGRVGKVYARLASGEWKMTMHTGVLDYRGLDLAAPG
jgi:ketosteroid isomerase-like protein